MKLIELIIIFIAVVSVVDGQQCQARFVDTIKGKCSSSNSCQGTALASDVCETQSCCIAPKTSISSSSCITTNEFDILYNTPRATYLRPVLDEGIKMAGICNNCQAKAAFLAIAATMTNNFQTDEAKSSNQQFAADDNKYGNTEVGDGSRFRRRGFFGLRGRTMYERLRRVLPQYQAIENPESVAIIENAIVIAAELWKTPDLVNDLSLTRYADGSYYGFSMLWYKLTGDMKELAIAINYYLTFIRQLECGNDLYPGHGASCQYNSTHKGTCTADCITGLENLGTFCGCNGPTGQQCPNSPKHVRCCLDECTQVSKLDLGIIIDAGSSIGSNNHRLELQYAKDLLNRFDIGENRTHVGVINYSDDPDTLTWLNRDYYIQQKLDKISQAKYVNRNSDTAKAFQQANILFSYGNGRRRSTEGATSVIFILSDGISNDQGAAIRAAKVVKDQDITVVSISVGDKPHNGELRAICSPPKSENNFAISDNKALEYKLNQLISISCSQPAVLSSNTTITIEINKDKYQFLKVEIVLMGNKILITVTLLNGDVTLFYSFTNKNPKDPADYIDYNTKTNDPDQSFWTRFKSYFQRSSKKLKFAKNKKITLVLEKPSTDVNFAFIGIKGIDDDNKFEVKVDDCSKVYCKSSAAIMKLSGVLMIMSVLFLQ